MLIPGKILWLNESTIFCTDCLPSDSVIFPVSMKFHYKMWFQSAIAGALMKVKHLFVCDFLKMDAMATWLRRLLRNFSQNLLTVQTKGLPSTVHLLKRMGGWKLEAFKMALYMTFPVVTFYYFNQVKSLYNVCLYFGFIKMLISTLGWIFWRLDGDIKTRTVSPWIENAQERVWRDDSKDEGTAGEGAVSDAGKIWSQ